MKVRTLREIRVNTCGRCQYLDKDRKNWCYFKSRRISRADWDTEAKGCLSAKGFELIETKEA